MYTLLSGFYKYLVQKDEYFIVILGLDNAGKTVSKFTNIYKYLKARLNLLFKIVIISYFN